MVVGSRYQLTALTHGDVKMVERLLRRLRRHDPFNISLQIFHCPNSPLAMAQFYCNLHMYAGLYRNQQKNGRIWHKITEIGRIAIGKFTKGNAARNRMQSTKRAPHQLQNFRLVSPENPSDNSE
jgi:hypothetical protein